MALPLYQFDRAETVIDSLLVRSGYTSRLPVGRYADGNGPENRYCDFGDSSAAASRNNLDVTRLWLTICWLWRTWPVLVPIGIASVHAIAADQIAADWSELNQIISLVFQILGGLLVLYSIDSNLGAMMQGSLLKSLLTYVRSCPIVRRDTVVQIGAARMDMTGHPVTIRTGLPGKSVEERLAQIERRLEWLKQDLNDEVSHLKSRIQAVDERVSKDLSKVRSEVSTVETKVTAISIGGMKIQILGVCLLVYGAVASYVA